MEHESWRAREKREMDKRWAKIVAELDEIISMVEDNLKAVEGQLHRQMNKE